MLKIIIMVILLTGCAGTAEKLKDPDLTMGCKVIEAETKLGYFNQEGNLGVCKLKCSEKLPKGFYYSYSNSRTGCSVHIGDPK